VPTAKTFTQMFILTLVSNSTAFIVQLRKAKLSVLARRISKVTH